MNTQQIELARRVVSSERFRWMPGMKALGKKDMPTAWFRLEETIQNLHGDWSNATPDLSDPATIGCLVHLIRLAWKAPIDIHESRGAGSFWGISIVNEPLEDDCPYFMGYSQQEILVKAFESAPASLEG